MGKGLQGALLRALGAREHALTVTGKKYRADHFLRIHFHSDTLLDQGGEAPGDWIRAWFPDPDGSAKQFQRGYTLLNADPATGRFSVDFVIHHPVGPATHWAVNCEPGDQIAAMRYSDEPFHLLDPAPKGYLFLGDLAGYPAITSVVASIPADNEVVVYLERHSEADEQLPLPSGPNITAAWVDELPDGQALVQAIASRDWTDWYAWITGESTSTRHAKTLLQREYGLNRATLHATAYWVRGRAMGRSQTLDELDASALQEQARAEDETADDTGVSRRDAGGAGARSPRRSPAGGGAPDTAHAGTGHTARSPEETALPETHAPAGRTVTAAGERTPPRTGGTETSGGRRGVLAPARPALIASGVFQGLLSILQVVPFILFAETARLFLVGAERDDFVRTALWAVAVMGATALLTSVLMFAMHLYDARFSAALRRRLMDKLSTLPLGWFTSRGSGEVKKLVGDEVTSLHYVVVHAVSDIVAAVVAPVTVLTYLFAVEWRLGLVMLLPIAAYVTVMVSISRRDADKAATVQRQLARSSSQTQAFVTTHEVSRVFGDRSIVDLDAVLGEQSGFVAAWQRQTGPLKIIAVMINRPTTVLGVLVLAGFGLLLAGWISALDLVPFLILGTSFGGQLMAVSMSVYALVQGLQSKAGLELLLDTPSLPPPAGRTVPEGHVVFDRVRFGYGPDRDVLRDFSLTLAPGTVTALVGPSGAGKSTVAALLARLWDAQSGTVSVNGRDVRDMTSDKLYSLVTILLQDVQLIHASIRENIALTSPGATDEQIVEAAKAAHVHDRIRELPDSYDTVVAADRLSGGERQRIGIARALLADTPIVVLDEATAAADPDSERAIQQGLDRLLSGRTVLMIAHRLHTVANADRIVVMDGGRVCESGTHAELLASGGAYAGLWNATSYEEVS